MQPHYLPDLDAVAGFPAAINDMGEIVGTLFNQDNWSRAVLWQPDGDGYTAIDLGTLGGLFAQATDINNYSQIVGLASLEEAGFFAHAVYWDNFEIFDLGTIGGDNSIATGINNDGFIVGAAQDTASVSSATGENGGYAFPVSVRDRLKDTPVYVFRDDDPNLFRLLQFGFDGEYIGVAGTFIPHEGSPPTTAIYTGFIDSMLNVSHHDVTITDSVILVLASGELQTDLKSNDDFGVITTFELSQIFPNPFNPETQIQYQVPHKSKVRLVVYNILGQPIRTLFDGEQTAGRYNQTWDTLNDAGQFVSSGIYMYRFEAKSENGESYIKTRKMIVIR